MKKTSTGTVAEIPGRGKKKDKVTEYGKYGLLLKVHVKFNILEIRMDEGR